MLKHLREYKRAVQAIGLHVSEMRKSGGGHIQVTMTTPTGTVLKKHVPCSPSDVRWMRNNLAELRREVQKETHEDKTTRRSPQKLQQ